MILRKIVVIWYLLSDPPELRLNRLPRTYFLTLCQVGFYQMCSIYVAIYSYTAIESVHTEIPSHPNLIQSSIQNNQCYSVLIRRITESSESLESAESAKSGKPGKSGKSSESAKSAKSQKVIGATYISDVVLLALAF